MFAAALLAGPANAAAIGIHGVTADGTFVRFDSATPGVLNLLVLGISGLGAGETIAGLDIRPANGKLYALTIGSGGAGRLYTLNPASGAASLVGLLSADPADVDAPYTALSGTKFGMNFQPAVDRLRVVSDSGMNIRINPATTGVITDVALNPGTPHVVGIAYTNSYPGASVTTLYDIDSGSDALLNQSNANGGLLASVGSLGVATSDIVGFDIVSLNGDDFAYATLRVGGTVGLYTINLTTGAAGLVGSVLGNPPIIGLAIEPDYIFHNGFD
ncbi:MAG TPA: DUF4394 domain-containing protein [Rudaea sp.]|nr:DUF4394 domain-containing protein [Rudaea sp.]